MGRLMYRVSTEGGHISIRDIYRVMTRGATSDRVNIGVNMRVNIYG